VTERPKILVIATITTATLTCFGWILLCPALISLNLSPSQGLRAGISMMAVSLGAWLVCLVWLLMRAALVVRRLPKAESLPPGLVAAMVRTGVQNVTCLALDAPTAFCAGALRPRVLVSESLLRSVGEEELDAILLHEQDHMRRFEPLVRATTDAAAQVFFYVPLLRWWSRTRIEDAELRADRAALTRLGPRPVAAALWALSGSPSIQGAAAFGGVAELRVAQVLGDPMPRREPGWSVVSISAMGSFLAFEVASCLLQGVQHLT